GVRFVVAAFAAESAGGIAAFDQSELLASLRAGSITGYGAIKYRRRFRRLLRGPAVLRIGRHCLRLVMAQVELYSERTGYLRCDLVRLVRNLRFYFSCLSKL